MNIIKQLLLFQEKNNSEPKTEELYRFAKNNIVNLRKKNIREKVEKFLAYKKKIYDKNNNGNYFQYLGNLSNKISQYDVKESMKKTYNFMGLKMFEEKRSKIKEVEDLEKKIKKKGKELLFSLLLQKSNNENLYI